MSTCVRTAAAPCGTPAQCGSDRVYCLSGAATPVNVSAGYYTDGIAGMRSAQLQCSAGSYCPGDGRAYLCPSGVFGNVSGLSSVNCSGACGDGKESICNFKMFGSRNLESQETY